MTPPKRPPLSERTALRTAAREHLLRLATKIRHDSVSSLKDPLSRISPPRASRFSALPISPAFERAMVSVIADGSARPERLSSWRRTFEADRDLVLALVSHRFLSRDTLRWATLHPGFFWRSPLSPLFLSHPACTVAEAVVVFEAGRGILPTGSAVSGVLDERWPSWEGWLSVFRLWSEGGNWARDRTSFYRFADLVGTYPEPAREVFVRLAADVLPLSPYGAARRTVWDLLRAAERL